eukprot:336419-Pleurochrysis_carterae.AAC.1
MSHAPSVSLPTLASSGLSVGGIGLEGAASADVRLVVCALTIGLGSPQPSALRERTLNSATPTLTPVATTSLEWKSTPCGCARTSCESNGAPPVAVPIRGAHFKCAEHEPNCESEGLPIRCGLTAAHEGILNGCDSSPAADQPLALCARSWKRYSACSLSPPNSNLVAATEPEATCVA